MKANVTLSRNKREGKFFFRHLYFSRYETRKDRKDNRMSFPKNARGTARNLFCHCEGCK